MTRLGYTSAQLGDVCAAILDMADDLPTEEADLRQRINIDQADGYPTNSGLDRGSPTSETDDDGTPLPPRSDPVARLVTNRDDQPDPLEQAARTAWHHIQTAMRSLEAAASSYANTRRPPELDDDEHRARDICWSCQRAARTQPVYRDSNVSGQGRIEPRCRQCYDWALAHQGINPPLGVVECWADGRRLTTKIVDQATTDDRAQRRAKRKKKRR